MKRKLRTVTCLTFLIIIASSFCYVPVDLNVPSLCESREDFSQSAYDYMEIDTADDFISNGWTGNGSESNPFVLEEKTLGSIGNYLYIRIFDTNYYFEIRNCQLLLTEITFVSVSNGKIKGCTLVNSSISIDYSSYCIITENDFSYSLYDAADTIRIYESSHCEIQQNHLSYGHTGVFIINCNDTIISGNTFIDFAYGAISPDLTNTTLRNNIFENTGIRIEFWGPRIAGNPPVLENNSVNGKDIGLFYNITETQIDAAPYGQIILGNCTEIIVTNGTFVSCTTGVQFLECVNCTIDGALVSDCWQGMYFERCSRTSIVNCQVNNSLEEGVFLSSSPFYWIENCTLKNNLNGILPHIYSNNGTVVNCTIRENRYPSPAISVGVGIFLSNNSTAIGNTISGNNVGLYIYGGHCLVVNNTITYNDYGIYLGTAYDGYGENCFANRIYRNYIGWNYQANAYDACHRYNEWDDGVGEGNGWSDYYGIGLYQISRYNIDHHPHLIPEGGISQFSIHLSLGVLSSILVVTLIVIVLKRRNVISST